MRTRRVPMAICQIRDKESKMVVSAGRAEGPQQLKVEGLEHHCKSINTSLYWKAHVGRLKRLETNIQRWRLELLQRKDTAFFLPFYPAMTPTVLLSASAMLPPPVAHTSHYTTARGLCHMECDVNESCVMGYPFSCGTEICCSWWKCTQRQPEVYSLVEEHISDWNKSFFNLFLFYLFTFSFIFQKIPSF